MQYMVHSLSRKVVKWENITLNTKLNFCGEKHIERLREHYDKELEAKDK